MFEPKIVCKQCGKPKLHKDFTWLKSTVCRDCHLYNAINWQKLPFKGSIKATKQRLGRPVLNDNEKNGLE